MTLKVTFVTGNDKKWSEMQAILGSSIELSRKKIDLPEIQGTVEEIALWKCREATKLVNGPVITEDVCLCFDALAGLPGPYIKWFLQGVGLEGLNDMLAGFEDKNAKAVCTVAFCMDPQSEPILFKGITQGRIVRPRGDRAFGWDPIFEPEHESGMTYAEMPSEVKNTISHRYKALDQLREHLNSLL